MKKILFIFGTRPEAIKIAPIIFEARKNKDIDPVICISSQHKEMLSQVLDLFGINADYDLEVMVEKQTLSGLSAKLLLRLQDVFEKERPDVVLVQGDTTSTLIGALAAFYHKVPVAYVEAGLRSYDKYQPYPEEINRKMTSSLADLFFAPSQRDKQCLLQEYVSQERIFVTGNTVIDALKLGLGLLQSRKESCREHFYQKYAFDTDRKFILVTGHRRENLDKGLKDICLALKAISKQNSQFNIVYPLHLNPSVQETVSGILSGIDNIFLIPPQDYLNFIYLMQRSYLILSDSGGVQEEASYLHIPLLIMRNVTERGDVLTAGAAMLVGTDSNTIVNHVDKLIHNEEVYQKMKDAVCPFGNGTASEMIINTIMNHF